MRKGHGFLSRSKLETHAGSSLQLAKDRLIIRTQLRFVGG